MTTSRSVSALYTAHRQLEGGGFPVRRPFPSRELRHLDPFLILDEMGPVEWPPGGAIGAPDHPHRGFETVTYVLEGAVEHRDSQGNRGVLGAGDVQWMTAGAGVIHSEMPTEQLKRDGGPMHGFQLWVNLPAKDKMMRPRYQEISGAALPQSRSEDGRVQVRVVAGESLGVDARIDTLIPIAYLHFKVEPGGRHEQELPEGWNAFAYVFRGGAAFSEGSRDGVKPATEGQIAVFRRDGGRIVVSVPEDAEAPAEFLLIAGEPIGEPIVQYGPFVMNTKQEIIQAITDYNAGQFGRIAAEVSRE